MHGQFRFFFTVVLLCYAHRTQTGGQSSESSRLSGAPFLSCPADTGDLHTHENQGVGLESRETERVQQGLEAYCWLSAQESNQSCVHF